MIYYIMHIMHRRIYDKKIVIIFLLSLQIAQTEYYDIFNNKYITMHGWIRIRYVNKIILYLCIKINPKHLIIVRCLILYGHKFKHVFVLYNIFTNKYELFS